MDHILEDWSQGGMGRLTTFWKIGDGVVGGDGPQFGRMVLGMGGWWRWEEDRPRLGEWK